MAPRSPFRKDDPSAPPGASSSCRIRGPNEAQVVPQQPIWTDGWRNAVPRVAFESALGSGCVGTLAERRPVQSGRSG